MENSYQTSNKIKRQLKVSGQLVEQLELNLYYELKKGGTNMLMAKIAGLMVLIIWLVLAAVVIYIVYLLIKALRKYINSAPVRKKKKKMQKHLEKL